MPPHLPVEVSACVLSHMHLAQDKHTLKNAALVSRDFCFLAQELLFSAIEIGKDFQRLFALERILLSSPRRADIALAIQTLSFTCSFIPFCEVKNERGGLLRAIQLIADRATRLRAVHFGPFGGMPFSWDLQSEEGKSTLIRLLTAAEDVTIEGVQDIPRSLFPKLTNLKSLDFSASFIVPDDNLDRSLLPSPQALTVHTGVLGCRWRDMVDTLRIFKSLQAVDFSNLRTLYLHIPISPGRNALYRDVIALCDCKRLESLRFYISRDDEGDWDRTDAIIDLSRLTSLKYLFIIVNVEDNLACMAKIIDTISIPQTHLRELALFFDTCSTNMEEDEWIEEVMAHEAYHSSSWRALDVKLAQILNAWNDTLVVVQLPPVDAALTDEVFEYIAEQLPGPNAHMYQRFHVLDFSFRNIVRSLISFREDADQARILEEYVVMMGLDEKRR